MPFSAIAVNAEIVPAADYVPADAIFMVEIPSVSMLKEHFRKTTLQAISEDPAMQPFLAPVKEQFTQTYNKFLDLLWSKIGLEDAPKSVPFPEGQVALALFVQPRAVKVPDYSQVDYEKMTPEDWQTLDPDKLPTRESEQADLQVVFWADMGEKVEALEELFDSLDDRAAENNAILQRETVRSVELTFYKKNEESDINFDTFGYGFYKNTFIAGSSLKYLREVISRMAGADEPVLSQEAHYRSAMRKVGPADMGLYLNIQSFVRLARQTAAPEAKQEMDKTFSTLGLDNLRGLTYVAAFAPENPFNTRVRLLLSYEGEPTGIVKLLTPQEKRLDMNRLLTKDLTSMLVAHYDLGQWYAQILQMITDISGSNPEMVLQSTLAMTGGQGEGARPPVDLRQDIFGQITDPMLMTTRYQKPYTDPANMHVTFATGTRDGKKLDEALGRIHQVFISRGNPELRRELLNQIIYLIPGSEAFITAMGPTPDPDPAADAKKRPLAFSVFPNHLVLAPVDDVEQSIRDQRNEDLQALQAQPLFQHAKRFLPDRAGAFFYRDEQVNMEYTWAVVKENIAFIMDMLGEDQPDKDSDDFDKKTEALFRELLRSVDLSTLPDFERVRKYFGVSAGFLTTTEEGLFLEGFDLKPPAD